MGKQSIIMNCKYEDEECLLSRDGLCCHDCLHYYTCKSKCDNTPEKCGCERVAEQPIITKKPPTKNTNAAGYADKTAADGRAKS